MIAIIGAGPAGSYLAYLLAKKGHSVELFEEHPEVGNPIQCTGLVTHSIYNTYKPLQEVIVNRIDKVRIFAPDGRHISIRFREKNIVFDRRAFDVSLAPS